MSQPITLEFGKELFTPLFYKLQKADTRFVINYGGAGSGKSYTQTQHELIKALQQKETTLVVRKYASTLKHSVIALARRILDDWGLNEYYIENKSDFVFTFPATGSTIIFKGLDDTEKIKSIAGITRIWAEEANELTKDDFNQLNLRLRGRDNLQFTMTFNPIDENHWLKKIFFDGHQYDSDTTLIKTTYKDNRFIDDVYKLELERYANLDQNYHRIYALGEWGIIDDARIFTTWETRDFPMSSYLTKNVVYGLDFGYSQDPAAAVRTTTYHGEIYLDEVFYRTNLTNSDIANLLKQDGYRGEPVVCDSAEPKSITDLRRMGINAMPADKTKGSVNGGIDFLKRNRVFISGRSQNLAKENLYYRWKKDRLGNFLPVPEDAHNHLCDATRYAYSLGIHDRKTQNLDKVFF